MSKAVTVRGQEEVLCEVDIFNIKPNSDGKYFDNCKYATTVGTQSGNIFRYNKHRTYNAAKNAAKSLVREMQQEYKVKLEIIDCTDSEDVDFWSLYTSAPDYVEACRKRDEEAGK